MTEGALHGNLSRFVTVGSLFVYLEHRPMAHFNGCYCDDLVI